MRQLYKLFSLGVVGLTTIPAFTSLSNTTTTNTKVLHLNSSKHNTTDEEENLRCTIAYVGKECTKDGIAIIARSNDATPNASNSYLKRVAHNELANTVIKNDFGFEYKMPSTTYGYVSSPDGWYSNPKDDRHLWQSMGINENGVGITCTLTCYTRPKAQTNDPFLDSGIAEEAFNQILAAQATSAKHAMQIAADIIKVHGSEDANIIMATDQNETWLMEIYTGHHFCAVKLPDDKVLIGGNEFLLDSLDDLGINESNIDEKCILSEGLLQYAIDNSLDTYTSETHDIYHLNLFQTFAGVKEEARFSDGCHMRTWRGYSLWNSSNTEYQTYEPQKKYPALFKPTHKDGSEWKDMTISDVMEVYRDEFDEIIKDESNPNHTYFQEQKDKGALRTIATETARLVHIITSNPKLPKELAVNALYTPSSANYTPFVLLNNGITSFNNDEYAYCPDRWSYDEKSSSVLFRKINSIAWPHREKYGYPLQELFRSFENIYITQMQQVIEDASKSLSIANAKAVITNFNNVVRSKYIDTVRNVGEDLLWHDMNQDHRSEEKINEFVGLIDLKEYLTQLGWTNFNVNGNTITFKYQEHNGKLVVDEGYVGDVSKLTIDDNEYDINVKFKNNKAYVGIKKLNEAIGENKSIVKININDYLPKAKNYLPLILSLSIGLPIIAAAVAVPIIVIKQKNKKAKVGK